MTEDKKAISRRDLLFGALKKLRRDDDFEDAPPPRKAQSDGPDHFLLGNVAFSARNYSAAMDHYRQAVKAIPNHDEARRRLGYCLYRMEQYIQARVEFERLLHGGKDNFASLYLGLTLARMNMPDKAIKAWKDYFNPDEVRIAREINLQCALLASPDPPEASEAADEVEQAVEDRKRELAEAGSQA